MPSLDRGGSTEWRKSSKTEKECVEVRFVGDAIEVRHSMDPNGAILTFTGAEWAAFIEGVRLSKFDASNPHR